MHFNNALDYLKEKAGKTENREVCTTLEEIHAVMLTSGLADGKRWADKIESVIAYVEAGNYAFCHQDIRKMLNKRSYVKNGNNTAP